MKYGVYLKTEHFMLIGYLDFFCEFPVYIQFFWYQLFLMHLHNLGGALTLYHTVQTVFSRCFFGPLLFESFFTGCLVNYSLKVPWAGGMEDHFHPWATKESYSFTACSVWRTCASINALFLKAFQSWWRHLHGLTHPLASRKGLHTLLDNFLQSAGCTPGECSVPVSLQFQVQLPPGHTLQSL